MSDDERERWNQRYATGEYQARTWPSEFLEEWLDRLHANGRALDLACGAGRNALRLAEAGFRVDAVDISEVALEQGRAEAERRGLDIRWIAADLDAPSLEPGAYDLITVFRYRNPHLWPRLWEAAAVDGFIIVEHHMDTTAEVDGPSRPEFRLRPQELLEAFGHLRVLHYSETLDTAREGLRFALQRIVVCNGDPGF